MIEIDRVVAVIHSVAGAISTKFDLLKVSVMLACVGMGAQMAASSEAVHIDQEMLDSFSKESTISGVYLNAWNSLIKSKELPSDMENYLVTFSETGTEILIYFTKPAAKPIVGGGNGVASIGKSDFRVISFQLSR
mgnify:CR=1 FL=1